MFEQAPTEEKPIFSQGMEVSIQEYGINLYQFHDQKALFKVPQICNINFWIGNDPPPPFLALFQKFIQFGIFTLP